MNILFLFRASRYIRTELKIIFLVMIFLLGMPILSVFAYTHVNAPAEANQVYDVASYPGDYYAWGNCTWWAAMRRSQIGEPIPNSWGNAATWAYYAEQDGYLVDHMPSPGAIMQISNVDHGLGHVAFVESVDPDGTWHISEMNVLGLDLVDYKTMSPSSAASYNFIHNIEQ
jgi:surface antigen